MEILLLLLFSISSIYADKDAVPVIKEHPSSMVARRNDPATLNCAASGSPRISWYRDGEEVTTSLQDPRSHRVLLPSGSLFFLRVSTGRRETDAGTYWCVASNSHGTARSKNATLTVASLSYGFFREPEATVKTTFGDSVTLPCRPPKGFPPPDVTWLKDEKEVTSSNHITVTPAGDLVIDEALMEDSGSYMCKAHNLAGVRESKASQLIVMTPPWFEERPINLTIISGITVELACQAKGYPMPELTWRKLDGKMPLGRATIEDQRLVLQQVSAADSGIYVCEAESEAGLASATATLTVVDAPRLIQRPQNQLVLEESPIHLPCSVEGDPRPMLVWRLPTESRSTLLLSTQSNGHAFIAEDGETLSINKSGIDDSGIYKCWGISSGGGVSSQAKVTVVEAYPPPVIGIGPKDQTLSLGSVATLPCEGVSEMAELTLSWWFRPAAHLPPRRLSESSDKPVVSIAENGALTLKDLSVDYSGIYKCVIEATTGEVEQEAILRVSENVSGTLPPYLPAPPSKPRVMAVADTTIHLSWLPNSHVNDNTSQSYIVEHWRYGWEEWRIADSTIKQESCIVKNLTPGLSYTFLVRAVNGSGVSFPSPWSDPVTTETQRDKDITLDEVGHAQRRLSRSILTLANTSIVSSESVLLKWKFLTMVDSSVEGVLAYAISANGNTHLSTIFVSNLEESSHTMIDLQPNTHYTFFLVPFWRSLEGTPSNSHSLVTPEDVPAAAPSNVRVTLREDGATLITWTPLSAEEARGKIVGYHVTLTHNGTHVTETVPTSWLETRGLTNSRLYTVRVAAITGAGHGPFSAPLLMDTGPGSTNSHQDVQDTTIDEPDSVVYAHAQTGWLIYLLVPLLIVMFVITLLYIRKLHQKTPPVTQHPPPSVYQDPSICPSHHSVNMYSEQKLWRPDCNSEAGFSPGFRQYPDQAPNEYAEPRIQRANETAEPYATTALLVPASPRFAHRGGYLAGPPYDPNMQANWRAYVPAPPASPPPNNHDRCLEDRRHHRTCLAASQYDNVGSSQQYTHPCSATSEHTYEPYSQATPSSGDQFHMFNSLQGKGRQKASNSSRSSSNDDPKHSNTQ